MNEDKNVVFDGEFAYDEPSNGTLYKGKDILFKGTLNESAVT